jgi:transcription factor C subunit 6
LRRVVDGGKTTIFQQFWFVHEWRKGTPEQEAEEAPTGRDKDEGTAVAADPTATGLPEHPPTPTSPEQLHRRLVAKRGLSRFVEGFRAEKTSVTPRAGETQPNSKHGMSYTTIYEEKTAITALAWNPNVHVGGWAAAGMADGLLRIEDIAG